MFLRVVLLGALSSTAFGAGVSIELDAQVVLESIDYTAPIWIDHDDHKKGLSSFQEFTIIHPDVKAGTIIEQENQSLDVLYNDDHLTRVTISLGGYKTVKDYPQINNDVSSYGLMNGVPYLLDKTDDTIWQWDENYWKSLKTSLDLPSGDYNSVFAFGGSYILSVEDELNGGLWEIGLTNQKLSDVNMADGVSLAYTPQGWLQIYTDEQNNYQGNWLNDNSDFYFNLSFSEFPYFRYAASYSGTVLNFTGERYIQPYWLPANSSLPVPLILPEGWRAHKGCYSSAQRAFCIIAVGEQDYGLYEVIDGELILDTQLDQTINDLIVVNIRAVGEHRFISAESRSESSSTFYLLSASSAGTDTIFEADVEPQNGYYFILASRDPSVFYWVGKEEGKTPIYKAGVTGDLVFKRNVEPAQDEEIIQDGKNLEDNQNLSVDSDSEDGIGSFPASLILLMFVLLFPRFKRRFS